VDEVNRDENGEADGMNQIFLGVYFLVRPV